MNGMEGKEVIWVKWSNRIVELWNTAATEEDLEAAEFEAKAEAAKAKAEAEAAEAKAKAKAEATEA